MTKKKQSPVHELGKMQTERERQAAADAEALAKLDRVQLPAATFDDEGYEIIPQEDDALRLYRFTVQGQKFSLPNMQYLPIDLALALGRLTQMEAFEAIFERFCPGLSALIDGQQLTHISKRWRESSTALNGAEGTEIGLGE